MRIGRLGALPEAPARIAASWRHLCERHFVGRHLECGRRARFAL